MKPFVCGELGAFSGQKTRGNLQGLQMNLVRFVSYSCVLCLLAFEFLLLFFYNMIVRFIVVLRKICLCHLFVAVPACKIACVTSCHFFFFFGALLMNGPCASGLFKLL